jgi:rhodanese-related sulfurtransferase
MIDVREPQEWQVQHLEGVIKISLGAITAPETLAELAPYKDKEIAVICRSGGRSGRAAEYLTSQGFTNVRNMTGGMLAWKAYIDSTFNV